MKDCFLTIGQHRYFGDLTIHVIHINKRKVQFNVTLLLLSNNMITDISLNDELNAQNLLINIR